MCIWCHFEVVFPRGCPNIPIETVKIHEPLTHISRMPKRHSKNRFRFMPFASSTRMSFLSTEFLVTQSSTTTCVCRISATLRLLNEKVERAIDCSQGETLIIRFYWQIVPSPCEWRTKVNAMNFTQYTAKRVRGTLNMDWRRSTRHIPVIVWRNVKWCETIKYWLVDARLEKTQKPRHSRKVGKLH